MAKRRATTKAATAKRRAAEADMELLILGTAVAQLGSTLLRAAPELPKEPENTYGLPAGTPIAEALKKWLNLQLKATLGTLPEIGAPLPAVFAPLADYDDKMASAMTPLLSSYWDESGKRTRARIGLDPGQWQVTNPHTRRKIQQAALDFCRATNEATTLELNTALVRLKVELVEGIVEEGDSIPELTKRVQRVFDQAEKWRAKRIARTETSRAVHAAQLQAAEESGVVAGMEWLASSNACSLCLKVATEANRVKLGDAFAIVGDNPTYKTIRYPPLHPHDRCTVVEVLLPEYGGPKDPQWATTLQQPQKGLGDVYTPPPGKKVPKPDPGRLAQQGDPLKLPAGQVAELTEAGKKRIAKAVEYARSRGVDVEPNAADDIEASKGDQAYNVAGMYHAGTRKVYINQRSPYWNDPAATMSKAGKDGPTGPWLSTDRPAHIIIHEVGHAEHHKAVGTTRYQEIRAREFTPEEKAVARRVSRYAATKPIEIIPEVYAGLVAGKRYDDEVMALYEELGGPRP